LKNCKNDRVPVRWLAAGPERRRMRISIPENEPGSSIMPWQSESYGRRAAGDDGRRQCWDKDAAIG